MVDRVDSEFGETREGDERVTPIELILDVVFVLAFSAITAFMVLDHSWHGVFDALVILALLWRGWFGFAWLTSITNPESTAVRLAIFTAMGAFVVMALIIPRTFGSLAAQNHTRFLVSWFVVAYVVIRLVHIYLGLRSSRGDERSRRTVIRTSIGGAIAVVLLVSGVAVESIIASHVLWLLAVIVDYTFAFIFARFGWRLIAGHFAERHGLIVIIALGETILAAGVGAQNADLTDPFTIGLALLGVGLLATMWGAYFDGTEIAAERALVSAPAGLRQNIVAIRAYTLLHFPIVVGTVLIALGPKSAIAHPHQPLQAHTAGAFFGGLALFLLGHVGFRYITTKRLNVPRLSVGLLMIPLIAVGMARPAWESLVLVTAVMVALVSKQRGLWGARSRN